MSKLAKRLDPLLEPTLAAVRRLERFLGPEDDWVEDDRRVLYEAAQWLSDHTGEWHTFVKEKGDSEWGLSVMASSDDVEAALHAAGWQRNLLSNRKWREPAGGGRQWAVGSWVYDPVDQPWQHHVYLFDGPGTERTDVYCHKELSVREGAEHLTGWQNDAWLGALPEIFEEAGLYYYRPR